MEVAALDYGLVNTVYQHLQEYPHHRPFLEEMVAWEQAHPSKDQWDGWKWQHVHTPVGVINHFVGQSIVDLRYDSNKSSYYRLKSVADTKEALGMDAIDMRPKAETPPDLSNLFGLVVGHERVKALLRYAIQAEKPTHFLLVGQPGTAKTLLLSDIARLPTAEMYVGSTTTKAGLVGLLLMVKPRFLVLDELDKMQQADMGPLLNLMETGMVTRLQHRIQERVTMDTRVFAGANDITKIPAPILSRFAKMEFPPYTTEEFVQVATAVLAQREGQGPAMAELIAREVAKHSTDIRDAVRVARLARNDPRGVMEVVRCLWKVTPIGRR